MGTVSFSYRSQKESANVEVRFTFRENEKRRSVYSRASYEVTKQFWEEYTKGIEFRDSKKIKLKQELDDLTRNLRNYILKEAAKTRKYSSKWLASTIKAFESPEKESELPTKLIDYFDYYLNDAKRNEITHPPTIRKWMVTVNKLKRYEKENNVILSIGDVNDVFKNNFIDWSHINLYSAETIKKDMRLIKQICTHAQTKDLFVPPDLVYFRYRAERDTPIIYLSFDEINKIIQLKDLPNYLDNARDWLIISCYTGQRVSDFMRFSPEMISGDEMKVLEIEQEKTGKHVVIPLMPEVLQVIKKHNNGFPRPISDQRYNEYIKKVCKKAGIAESVTGRVTKRTSKGIRGVVGSYPKYQLITSHIGRRSFATNYYGKIPTAYLKELTGHGTEAMLLKYIGKKSDDLTKDIFKAMTKARTK